MRPLDRRQVLNKGIELLKKGFREVLLFLKILAEEKGVDWLHDGYDFVDEIL